ncbi:MAG: flagellar biosynthesis protein FlhF [Sphaerochaetaceae bacterium]|mgnify:CR=1 FL=1|nr:flagellar biosynthesis protein FlhF [Sphaerochaetaceae bacterium]
MNYITIVAPTYEEAVRKARDQYGDRVRIHSRKDVVQKGFLGLGKNRFCELTCYLTDEKPIVQKPVEVVPVKKDSVNEEEEKDIRRFEQEAKTPNPDTLQSTEYENTEALDDSSLQQEEDSKEEEVSPVEEIEQPIKEQVIQLIDLHEDNDYDPLEPFIAQAKVLLNKNDFSEEYIEWIIQDIRTQLEPALPDVPSMEEFELLVVDRIVSSVQIDHNSQLHPPKIFAVVGPTGVGKTTTIAKIAAIYGTVPPEEIRKKVEIVTMDSFRVGAYEQMENFGKALGIPVHRADNEDQLEEAMDSASNAELILIDTIGRSPRDSELDLKLKTMLSSVDQKVSRCYLAISASMKKNDIDTVIKQFGDYKICSVIITKTDETSTIGNVLSTCHARHLPLLFITDGQMVPRDIHKASSAFILGLLRGFNLDFNSLWNTQIGSDE